MKKLTAMLLALTMCLSLAALPAQAAFIPESGNPIIIDVGAASDDDDSTKPEDSIRPMGRLPDPKEENPVE